MNLRPPVFFAALVCCGRTVFAAPAEPAAEQPVAPAGQKSHSAVTEIVNQLYQSLPVLHGRVMVGVAPLESDAKPTRAEALSLLFANQLAGRLAAESPARSEALPASVTRGRGFTHLVYLHLSVTRGRVLASADVIVLPTNVWARIKNPEPGPVAHAFAEAPMDAEIRSYHEPLALVAKMELTRGQSFEGGIVALSCLDLDRDGAPEIVSVSPERVTLLRIREGKVVPIVSHAWSKLSPMDPTPLREPIALAHGDWFAPDALDEGRQVVASITDRARSVRFDQSFEPRSEFRAFAVPEAGRYACARLDASTLTGPLERCAPGDPAPRRASLGGRYDAFAAASLVDAEGRGFAVWAGREDGHLELFDDQQHSARLPSVGAQLAVGDLDQDGVPEVLTTLDVPRSQPDAVVIYSWDRKAAVPKERLRIPVAAGVQALAVCPPDSAGRAAFVLATSAELLVAR